MDGWGWSLAHRVRPRLPSAESGIYQGRVPTLPNVRRRGRKGRFRENEVSGPRMTKVMRAETSSSVRDGQPIRRLEAFGGRSSSTAKVWMLPVSRGKACLARTASAIEGE